MTDTLLANTNELSARDAADIIAQAQPWHYA